MDLIQNDSQFIIATHSPIVTTYPDSIIYELDNTIKKVNYEDTENYQIIKLLINNPKKC